MPNKFNVAALDGVSRMLVTQPDALSRSNGELRPNNRDISRPGHFQVSSSLAEREEEEARAIAAAAFYNASGTAAPDILTAGPGTLRGPIRYLPPGNVAQLYWQYTEVERSRGLTPASRRTFNRIFKSVGSTHLKFRHKTEHASCTTCEGYKKELKTRNLGTEARQTIMKLYTKHLVDQWLDRQGTSHAMELSVSCSNFLLSGQLLATLALSLSVWTLSADGVDQAKLRVPRVKHKTHAFERLVRPALHVRGVWLHGMVYHLGIADADMHKNTNNNVEAISRAINQAYLKSGRQLPLGLNLVQDNTSRECKNSKIIKFITALVALGVFRWVAALYQITGHTHGPLDGTFGQICVKLSFEVFDDDLECVKLLQQILSGLGVDAGTKEGTLAYKLDEAADWEEWWDQLPVSLSNLTGPEAPHFFKACARKDVGLLGSHGHKSSDEASVAHDVWSEPARPNDVVLVIKSRVASLSIHQIVPVLPEGMRGCMTRILQPRGKYPRKHMGAATRTKISALATELRASGVISAAAGAYLSDWAQGIRRTVPRPASYDFLSFRWAAAPARPSQARGPAAHDEPRVTRRVQVRVLGVGGGPLPGADAAEEADEPDAGPLVIAADGDNALL